MYICSNTPFNYLLLQWLTLLLPIIQDFIFSNHPSDTFCVVFLSPVPREIPTTLPLKKPVTRPPTFFPYHWISLT
jgi:hypothetical protein